MTVTAISARAGGPAAAPDARSLALRDFFTYGGMSFLAARFSSWMRKLTTQRRNWFHHRRRHVLKRRRWSERRRYGQIHLLAADGKTWMAQVPGRIALPHVMSFDDNCTKTLEAISRLRNHLLAVLTLAQRRAAMRVPKPRKPKLTGYRDFATMTHITPAAALVIAAEFERMKILTGHPPVVVNVGNWAP